MKESKEELRSRLRRRLADLPKEQARRLGDQVRQRVLALPEVAAAGGVLACLSFGTEIDTWSLVEDLLALGKRVYVPRTRSVQRELVIHQYPCCLRQLSFGLMEPRADAPRLADEEIEDAVDVALILGLAFDEQGFRLGYGAGYFDRFLAGRRFPAIGLAYDEQWVPRLPREAHDVPMAVVLTPTREVRRPA